jgi:hypothetical protein
MLLAVCDLASASVVAVDPPTVLFIPVDNKLAPPYTIPPIAYFFLFIFLFILY